MRSSKMLLLVLFTDNILLICNPDDVGTFKKKCPAVKYTDGKKYTARILALHEDRVVLQEVQRCLEEDGNSALFKNIELTEDKLKYSDVIEKHKKYRDASKLYLDPAILPSQSTNSEGYVFSFPEPEPTNFFQIQTDFIESKITRLEIHAEGTRQNLNVEGGDNPETVVQKDDLVENSEIISDANSEKISIEHGPTSQVPADISVQNSQKIEIPNENIMIEHVFHEQIFDKSEARTEHDSNTQILDVNNFLQPDSKDGICNQKEATEQIVSKMISPIENNTPKCEVEMLDEKNGNIEKSVENKRVSEYSLIVDNCDSFAVSNLNEITNRMRVDQSTNITSRMDENCNHSVASNLNEDIRDMAVDKSVMEDQIQKDFQKILREVGMTSSFSENMCHDLCGNSIYECIFTPNHQGKLNLKEPFEDGAANVPACDVAPNSKAFLRSSAFELSTEANSCVDELTEASESRLKPKVVCDIILTEKITYPRKERNISPSHDTSIMPTPTSSSTILETLTTNADFISADNREVCQFFASGVDGKGAKNDEDSESADESAGEEYIPSATESSSATDSDTEKTAEKSVSRKRSQSGLNSTVNITLGLNKQGTSAPDDTELVVTSSKTVTHTKKNFCIYCKTLQSKLARHLELVHSGEEDVKKFAALPPKNSERMQIIAAIRKNGNHLYNTDKRFNKGELLVVRRPQEKMKKCAKDFVACGNCCGQYARTVIRHHFKKCAKKSGHKERLVMVKSRKVSARIHEKANDLVRTFVFPYMREDDIVRGIRYDKLIIMYANKQCEKYGLHQHHYQMIRGRLRLLGRFLLTVKELNNAIKEFSDIFQPRHYDDAVKAVKIVAGFNETTRVFAHPAVASNLGTLLKYAGQIQRSEYIKEERAHDQKRVEDFLKLQGEDYGTSVNRAVLETQLQNNRRKKIVLPNLDDITKLHNFLNVERETHYEKLNEKFSEDAWRKLAEVTLISLQLFNRRRAGEIERVYIEDFNSYQGIDQVADKETYASLTKHGQALARKYVRFMIRGKLGRGVPVLVPGNILDSLVLICKYRVNAGVPESNPYLFGLPSKDRDRLKYLRACELLRQFAEQCGADVPNTLRGTQLRKHVATKCVSLNLSENEVSNLANFLGHADKIHKNIYRQPDMQNDIIKISQLLEMAQGTNDSIPDEDDSSSEEETNVKSAGPIEAEVSSLSQAEDTSYTSERPRQGKKVAKTNNSQTFNPAARPGHMHRRWTDVERSTVLGAFEGIMRSGKMPTGDQIQKLIKAHACLKGREVAQLRTWLHTQKRKM